MENIINPCKSGLLFSGAAYAQLFLKVMRQNAEKLQEDSSENYPELTIVSRPESTKREERPELRALGWEPRRQRLAILRSTHTASN